MGLLGRKGGKGKGEEMSQEDVELQKQIDSMTTIFLCSKEMVDQFSQDNSKIRIRDPNDLPIIKLKNTFLATEVGTTMEWEKEFLRQASLVLDDMATREKQSAINCWDRAWNPIRVWFDDEYKHFMLDVNRWPSVRKEFYEARQKNAAKPSPTNDILLEKAAEKYKSQIEIITGKLSSQKDVQKHHQRCINAYFQEMTEFHRCFHRNNLKILEQLREAVNANKPEEAQVFDELPKSYVDAVNKRLKSANKRPSTVTSSSTMVEAKKDTSAVKNAHSQVSTPPPQSRSKPSGLNSTLESNQAMPKSKSFMPI
ncbi:unnamed protein product, partial [Mesorhabditis belari]|uniref:BAR domain-containing protein n=1 Tax=Mesorhabditis belari TaxID=2138241 RepID=A0AAF3ECP0_9BILA